MDFEPCPFSDDLDLFLAKTSVDLIKMRNELKYYCNVTHGYDSYSCCRLHNRFRDLINDICTLLYNISPDEEDVDYQGGEK